MQKNNNPFPPQLSQFVKRTLIPHLYESGFVQHIHHKLHVFPHLLLEGLAKFGFGHKSSCKYEHRSDEDDGD